MSSIRHGLFALIAATVAAASALPLRAQTDDDPVVKLVAEPAELTMRVGEEAEVKITGVTRSGARVDAPSVRLVGPRSAVRVREGVVTALEAGDHALIATLVQGAGAPAGEPVMVRVPVRIGWPAVARVVVTPLTDHRLLAGTTIRLGVRAEHADGSERPDPEIEWRSDTPGIATVDGFGRVTASAPGTAAITATVDGVEGTATVSADPFTGSTLQIVGGVPRARTGDVIDFGAEVKDDGGQLLSGVPVEWYHAYEAPEYGTHNIWVEDDILYQAYYEGGVRMVDVSGELMGNLYTLGREIAVFKAFDPAGYVPNSPMAWSVMPFKGRIFFSDTNSGLWSARLVPRSRPIS